MLYFADSRWWAWHAKAQFPKGYRVMGLDAAECQRRYQAFEGERVTIENTGMMCSDPAVHMLHNASARGVGVSGAGGLSDEPNALCTGTNGGYQAINIATLAGAKKVLLIGYDMHFPGGRSHFHGGHPVKVPEDKYAQYAGYYKSMLPALARLGCEVVNCSPGSRITCFRFSTIAEELRKG